jgi:phage terminase small subunit
VAAKRAEISKATGVSVEGIIKRLWLIGDADIRDLFNANGGLRNPQELTKEQAAALASVKMTSYTPPGDDAQTEYTKEVRFWDKRAALVDLLKHLGAMPAEKPADVNVTVRVEMPREALREKLRKLSGQEA